MTEFPILQSLGSILLAAAAAVLLLRRLRVPALVAFMAAGILLGPVAGLVEVTDAVQLISRVGIALLLFLVGLQLSLDSIRDVMRLVLVTGAVQVVLVLVLTAALLLLLGMPLLPAGVLGLAAACTSTVVMIRLLGDRQELTSVHGRAALGVSMVQDLTTILALTFLSGVAGEASARSETLIRAGIGITVLLTLAAVSSRFVLPALFARVERYADTTFIWSLAWCFLFIVIAETAGLSVELGAFIAGLGLAQLRFADDMRRRVQPIVNFFLAAFFVSLGLQMQPGAALERWPLILALVLATCLLKPAIVYVTMRVLGAGTRLRFLSAVLLGQMSEFSFILATLAFTLGVIDNATMSVVTLAGFISITFASYAVMHAERIAASLDRRGLIRLDDSEPSPAPTGGLHDHVVVVGMNTLGRLLVRELRARGAEVLAIDTDPVKLNDLGCGYLLGSVDDFDVLEQACYREARLVVSALQIEDTNNLLAYRCHTHGVPVAIHAFDTAIIDDLVGIGVDHLLVPKHDGTRQMALRLRDEGVLGP